MSSFCLLCFGAPVPGKIYNNFISFSLVSRDAHTAGYPPSSCSPLSLPVKGGAQADGLQQLDVDGIVYLKLLGVIIGPLSGPLWAWGIAEWLWSGFGLLSMLKIVSLKSGEKGMKR